jgi:hypothetical protein
MENISCLSNHKFVMQLHGYIQYMILLLLTNEHMHGIFLPVISFFIHCIVVVLLEDLIILP